MKLRIKRFAATAAALLLALCVLAQPTATVQWSDSTAAVGDGVYEITFTGRILDGWHTYDLHSGFSSTVIAFEPSEGVELVGDPFEKVAAERRFDEIFGEEIGEYEGEIVLGQRVRLAAAEGVLRGNINWRSCQGDNCNMPEDWPFEILLPAGSAGQDTAGDALHQSPLGDAADPAGEGLLGLILVAIGWGLLALLTPCVFPMIPMTVSFFGAFEITLPGWMVNKSDRNADRGGLLGVFFMALTLVLVSFSCTGPIVGSAIIGATAGDFWAPILTMLVFSITFALPFTLFAMFPSLLKNLPKSGGWLNSVKVVLGFIEVALGFKFLSVADQTYHWGLLDREVYLAIWIVTFALLGFYLLGKLRFAHDSEVKTLSVGRLALAIVDFAFVVYMIPGMWGAPLKALSGYLPPLQTQDFILGQSPLPVIGGADGPTSIRVGAAQVKYGDFLSMPHGITGYFEWNEALAAARAAGKPLFVDVTGHGCVNCREMEQKVLSDERVQQILRDDYIVVALYTDDKARAAGEDWVTTESGTTLKEIGRINSYIARTRFNVNAQPNYIVADAAGAALLPPRGYDLSVEGFVDFLERGVAAYKARTQP